VSSFSFTLPNVDPEIVVLGNLLSLIAYIWSGLIIFKGLGVAHDFHRVQVIEVMIAYFTVFVLLGPVMLILLLGYMFQFILG
jgi:hypothetical protein